MSILARLGLNSEQFEKGLDKVSGHTQKFSDKFMGHIKNAVKVASVAFGAFVAKGLKDFVEFENSITEVFSLMPDITNEAMGKMQKGVRELAKELGLDLNDAVKSLYSAISAGVSQDNAIDFLRQSAKTAIAGVASLEDSVGALTTIINGYGMEAKEATRVSDVLFSVVKNGVTNMTELGQNIGKVTPIASSLGVAIEEVGAMFAVLTKQMGAGKTAEAGTAIRSMLAELAKEGMKANKNFKELGQGTFPEFIKSGGSVGNALMMMKAKAEESGKSLMDMFAGIEAGNGALMLVTKNGKELSSQLQNIKGDAGATEVAFKTMSSTLKMSIDRLLAKFKDLGITLAEQLVPIIEKHLPRFEKALENAVPASIEFMRSLIETGKVISEYAPTILKLLGYYVAFGQASKVATATASAFGKTIKGIVPHLTALFGGFELGKGLGDMFSMLYNRVENLQKITRDIKIGFQKEEIDNLMTAREELEKLRKELGLIKPIPPVISEVEKIKQANLSIEKQIRQLEHIEEVSKNRQRRDEERMETLKEELQVNTDLLAKYNEQNYYGNVRIDLETETIALRTKLAELERSSLLHMKDAKEATEERRKLEADLKAKVEARARAEAEAQRQRVLAEEQLVKFSKDLGVAMADARVQYELSKTEAGRMLLIEQDINALVEQRKNLIALAKGDRVLEAQEAQALMDLDQQILQKEQARADIIANRINVLKADELQIMRDQLGELEKLKLAEQQKANEAERGANAKKDEIQALRDQLAQAEKDLDPFRELFSINKFGDLDVNKKLLREQFKDAKARGELPEGVRTQKDFENWLKEEARKAKKKRDDLIEEGRLAMEEQKKLEKQEEEAKERIAEIEKNIKAESEKILEKQEELEAEKKKSLEEIQAEIKKLEDALLKFKDGKLKLIPDDFPKTLADYADLINDQSDAMDRLDASINSLMGKNGKKLEIGLDTEDLTRESTQYEILTTLRGYFINQ